MEDIGSEVTRVTRERGGGMSAGVARGQLMNSSLAFGMFRRGRSNPTCPRNLYSIFHHNTVTEVCPNRSDRIHQSGGFKHVTGAGPLEPDHRMSRGLGRES